MAYEMDFIGVSEELAKKDADAIAFRWKTENGFKRCVYDGGFEDHGESLAEVLNKYYFQPNEEKVIDAVFVSHSDQDHTSGLKTILENFTVKALYMNRPWLYVDELFDKTDDKRITKESLVRRLKEKFQYIADLEELADRKAIPIYEAFAGQKIENKLFVLSPSKATYKQLLIESDKTPLQESRVDAKDSVFYRCMSKMYDVFESWNIETLREDVSTSAENEMSIVLLGLMDDEKFLLTGDVGTKGLRNAIDYYRYYYGKLITGDIKFMQVPHHGGRYNVSPSILNELIGNKVENGMDIGITAFVSAAENSDHPYKMVINAYLRRGAKVMKTAGKSIRHQMSMPLRNGYSSIESEKFNQYVEKWND